LEGSKRPASDLFTWYLSNKSFIQERLSRFSLFTWFHGVVFAYKECVAATFLSERTDRCFAVFLRHNSHLVSASPTTTTATASAVATIAGLCIISIAVTASVVPVATVVATASGGITGLNGISGVSTENNRRSQSGLGLGDGSSEDGLNSGSVLLGLGAAGVRVGFDGGRQGSEVL